MMDNVSIGNSDVLYGKAIADAYYRIGSYVASGDCPLPYEDEYVMDQIAKIRKWTEERSKCK